MNAALFVALCDHLEKEVPELRWIDEDYGQLNTAPGIRPAVDYPCCLIDIQYQDCRDITDTEQVVKVSITLKIAFNSWGETNNKTPEPIRDKALERICVVGKVHACLQGWMAGEVVSPLSRRSARPSTTAGGLKVYTVVYDTTFEEFEE